MKRKQKTATVQKQPGKTKTADAIIGRRFEFERDDVIFTGRVVYRLRQSPNISMPNKITAHAPHIQRSVEPCLSISLDVKT